MSLNSNRTANKKKKTVQAFAIEVSKPQNTKKSVHKKKKPDESEQSGPQLLIVLLKDYVVSCICFHHLLLKLLLKITLIFYCSSYSVILYVYLLSDELYSLSKKLFFI